MVVKRMILALQGKRSASTGDEAGGATNVFAFKKPDQPADESGSEINGEKKPLLGDQS